MRSVNAHFLDNVMIEWTKEEIEKRTSDEVKALRDNAARRGNQQIVELCEAELVRRKPVRVKTTRPEIPDENRDGYYVSEFHFVCPNELAVRRNPDGSIWTGTWVVAAAKAEAGQKYNSLVALHTTKANPSYLQGTIKDWKKMPREARYADGQMVRTEFGIDFLIEPTHTPVPWKGDGAGEKGYAWDLIPSLPN
jgi:hypothetical protein